MLFILANIMLVSQQAKCQGFSFVFYNVENLFDIKDDPNTNDEEFSPEGDKHWTYERYHEKIDHIARVLVGVGKWELPAIVGLCEVENINVLFDLAGHRMLKEGTYKILHQDSPDRRGIDVGLLYRPDVFEPIYTKWIQISFQSDTSLRTRDILYTKGIVFKADTLHIFINHWPSRWGGIESSMPKRIEVAERLKFFTDSIFLADTNPNVLIAGDFNDTPEDSSIMKVLDARPEMTDQEDLVNIMYPMHAKGQSGTLKYRENWEIYDQIIVSPAIMELEYSALIANGPFIFNPEFLLVADERYLGAKPFRTYAGPQYLGGFSDHLPVYVRFQPYEVIDGVKYIR